MRVVTLCENVTANGTQTTVQVAGSPRENFSLQIEITATITVAVDVSLDGTNWQTVETKTADYVGSITAFPYLRVVTSGASGSPNATVKVGV